MGDLCLGCQVGDIRDTLTVFCVFLAKGFRVEKYVLGLRYNFAFFIYFFKLHIYPLELLLPQSDFQGKFFSRKISTKTGRWNFATNGGIS